MSIKEIHEFLDKHIPIFIMSYDDKYIGNKIYFYECECQNWFGFSVDADPKTVMPMNGETQCCVVKTLFNNLNVFKKRRLIKYFLKFGIDIRRDGIL